MASLAASVRRRVRRTPAPLRYGICRRSIIAVKFILKEEGAIPIASPSQVNRSPRFGVWNIAAVLLCLASGLVLIAEIHPVGDGNWFWYSTYFLQGKRLYADLHLPLQPLVTLEMAWLQRILGTRWLVSHVPAVLNLLLLIGGIAWVSRFLRSEWPRPLFIVCAFCATIDFGTFRFDDYHILTCCLVFFASGALLQMSRSTIRAKQMGWLAFAGATAGVCIVNRINDGAALVLAALISGWFLLPRRRWLTFLLVPIPGMLAARAILLLTKDNLHDWWQDTVVGAARIKGGTGHVLLHIVVLPYRVITEFMSHLNYLSLLVITATLVAGVFLLWRYGRLANGKLRLHLVVPVAVAMAIDVASIFLADLDFSNMADAIAAVMVYAMLASGIWFAIRGGSAILGRRTLQHPEAALMLIPFGQICSIAMSSGQWYPNVFPATAQFVLLAPICLPAAWFTRTRRVLVITVVALLSISTFWQKQTGPFAWWEYWSNPLDSPRVWYHHTLYGPMWIEHDNLEIALPVCQAIQAEKVQGELLSLPYPYANYFCGIPPWHGYVQTFFDTSSAEEIHRLMNELEKDPPEWIFYQRQIHAMEEHEYSFNHSKSLPHRDLDELINKKLLRGDWTIVHKTRLWGFYSDWYLIRTRPDPTWEN